MALFWNTRSERKNVGRDREPSGITPADVVKSMIMSAERHAAATGASVSFDSEFVRRAEDAALQIIITTARGSSAQGTSEQKAQAARVVAMVLTEYQAKKKKK